MFSLINIENVSLLPITVNATVNAIGSLGGGKGDPPDPKGAQHLRIPWQDELPGKGAESLLSWHTRVSPFLGRDTEMKAPEQWALSSPAARVQFIVADGGVGKSRLGAEFAETMKNMNWAAGFVSMRKGSCFPMEQAGTLLIIDYPEEHVEQVRELFKDLAELGDTQRVRVLLLTRQNRTDWEEVVEATGAKNIVEDTPIQLSAINAESAVEIFNHVAQAADVQLNPNAKGGADHLLCSQDAITEWMKIDSTNQRPLFIMAAAVNSAQSLNKPELQYSGKEAVTAVAQRELDRYIRLAEEKGFENKQYLL